jgi:hypothetical protein
MTQYIENDKGGVEGSDAAHRIDPSVFDLTSTQPPRWCHLHHPRCASIRLEARLENPTPTYFHAKTLDLDVCPALPSSSRQFCGATDNP